MSSAARQGVEDAEPRDAVLYARVKERNKAFMEGLAEERGASISAITDSVIDRIRQEVGDSNQRKPRKRSPAVRT